MHKLIVTKDTRCKILSLLLADVIASAHAIYSTVDFIFVSPIMKICAAV